MKRFLPLLALLVAVVGYKYYSWQRAEQTAQAQVEQLPTSIDTTVDVHEQIEVVDAATHDEVQEVRSEETAA
jgi:hypothetical protein